MTCKTCGVEFEFGEVELCDEHLESAIKAARALDLLWKQRGEGTPAQREAAHMALYAKSGGSR